MRSAMRTAHGLRLVAILAVGAFALHQLRYLLAFGGSPSAELAEHGHGYLADLLAPLAVLVLAASLATLVRGTEGASTTGASLGRRIAIFAVGLLVIYAGQEALEAILTGGDPVGIATAVAGGGWVALPLALGIGALAALLLSALEAAEHAIAVAHQERPIRSRAPAVRGRALPARRLSLPSVPLAFGLARRPPPPVPA
jgi:hypothetical protein